ncbi:MAG: BatD family protein [Flavobacteriaceae bacterium]
MLRINKHIACFKNIITALALIISGFCANAQIKTSVDSTSIKIGEELIISFKVELDGIKKVVFPDTKSFGALEVIENYKTDTLIEKSNIALIKQYGLTQFDSGTYTIPQQKILFGNKTLLSDSIEINVLSIKVDTTKQKLYDIKPILQVKKPSLKKTILNWLLILIAITAIISIVFYYWRKRELKTKNNSLSLPPYELAKLALSKLNEEKAFENDEVKEFYSDLTLILRKYLNDKVYNHSLESTTDELLLKLNDLNKSNKISLDEESIKNIEATLKRADLVKFAKSKPSIEMVRMDKKAILNEIESVKSGLPEPTKEEIENTIEYKLALQKKRKQKRLKQVFFGIIASALIISVSSIFFYGFNNVKDTLLRNPSMLLLKKDWVSSEYGAPGIIIETPVPLSRKNFDSISNNSNDLKSKIFYYNGEGVPLKIMVKSSKTKSSGASEGKQSGSIDLIEIAENELNALEADGASNILTKTEQFITPNGQEGLKTFGPMNYRFNSAEETISAEFIILGFSTDSLLQQLIIIWDKEDAYADEISNRIIASVELIKLNQE